MAYMAHEELSGSALVGFDTEELDELKSALVGVLIETPSIGVEEAYSLVFKEGRKIIWH